MLLELLVNNIICVVHQHLGFSQIHVVFSLYATIAIQCALQNVICRSSGLQDSDEGIVQKQLQRQLKPTEDNWLRDLIIKHQNIPDSW